MASGEAMADLAAEVLASADRARGLTAETDAPVASAGAAPPRVAAIVLAAGAGRRFGGIKQLAEVDGGALVARAVRAARSARGIDEVVVVVGAHADEVAAALPGEGERVVRCAAWDEGIGASIASGVEAALRGAVGGDGQTARAPLEAALVLLADQPLIDRALIELVLEDGLVALASGAFDAARAVGPDGAPGHPVLLGPVALATADGLTGDAGVVPKLDRARVAAIPTSGAAATFNVDEPGDLRVARALVAGAAIGSASRPPERRFARPLPRPPRFVPSAGVVGVPEGAR